MGFQKPNLVFPAPLALEIPNLVFEIPPTKGFQKVDLYNKKCYTNLIFLAHLGLRGKWYSVDTIIGDMVGL